MMALRLVIVLLALVVAGCATATAYQPADPEFGFAEQQLQSDRFRVSFRGNSVTPRETVENYLLLRAAEITLEQGFDFFVIAQRTLEADTSYVYAFHDFPHHGYYRLYPYGYRATATSFANAWPTTRYEAVAEIVMTNATAGSADLDAFDARELVRFLRPLAEPAAGD